MMNETNVFQKALVLSLISVDFQLPVLSYVTITFPSVEQKEYLLFNGYSGGQKFSDT